VGLDRRRGWGEGGRGRGRGRGRGGFLGGEKRSCCSSVASSSIRHDHTICDLNSTMRLPLADTAMLASSEVGQIGESREFDRCLVGRSRICVRKWVLGFLGGGLMEGSGFEYDGWLTG